MTIPARRWAGGRRTARGSGHMPLLSGREGRRAPAGARTVAADAGGTGSEDGVSSEWEGGQTPPVSATGAGGKSLEPGGEPALPARYAGLVCLVAVRADFKFEEQVLPLIEC